MADLDRIRELTQCQQEAETHWRQCERDRIHKQNCLRPYLFGFWPCFVLTLVLISSQMALIPLAVAGLAMLGYLAERSSGPELSELKRLESESRKYYENARDELTRELSQWD